MQRTATACGVASSESVISTDASHATARIECLPITCSGRVSSTTRGTNQGMESHFATPVISKCIAHSMAAPILGNPWMRREEKTLRR